MPCKKHFFIQNNQTYNNYFGACSIYVFKLSQITFHFAAENFMYQDLPAVLSPVRSCYFCCPVTSRVIFEDLPEKNENDDFSLRLFYSAV